MSSERRRVAITGVGLVSCLGHTYDGVIESLRAGRSGVRFMPEWDGRGLTSLVAGAIDDLDDAQAAAAIPRKLALGMSDAARYCAIAARAAVADAALTPTDLGAPRTGCLVGSGVGSVDAVYAAASAYVAGRVRRLDPYTVLRSMSSSCSVAVSNLLRIGGRSYSLSAACATSAHNIGHAFELVRAGQLDLALAGGGEDVSELIAAAFQALRLALSTHYTDRPTAASRPYDRSRDGFVLSGGGGIVVLEDLERARARGAAVRAEIVGYGATSDGFDLVLPEPEGRQAAACVRMALEDAGIAPAAVDYVNTHATSTVQGDVAEVLALQRTFGSRMPPFSSTKSMTGHAIGAAGVHELIFCTGMLEQGFIAPSINVEDLDPAFAGLPLITETTERDLTTVASLSLGFGGSNATLVLRRAGVDE